VKVSVKTGRRRTFSLISLGVFISAIGVGLIASFVDREQMARAFTTLAWPWLALAVAAVCANYFARLPRWAILLRPQTFRLLAQLRALLSGQLLNLVLPIRVGDVARALLLRREPGGSFARVLGSVLIEKAWDWLALCVLIVLCVAAAHYRVIPLPDWFLAPARGVGFIAAVILAVFGLAALLPELTFRQALVRLERATAWLPVRLRLTLIPAVLRLAESLSVLRRRDIVAQSALASGVVWGLGVAVNYAVMRAYAVDSWLAAMTLLVVLMLGLALPPSIAGIGVFEGLTMLTLRAFNVPLNIALAIGITLHGVVVVPLFIVTGLAWLATAARSS
jgi:hypothetical protein